MIRIDWNPVLQLGPVPIHWYGLTFALGLLVGRTLAGRWARGSGVPEGELDGLFGAIVLGTFLGARLYFVAQNDPTAYMEHPLRVFAFWQGGLAFFGGLFGATLLGGLYCRLRGISVARAADLFAPAIPIGGAIGRTSCGLAGMDFGTPTRLPWGVVYSNASSFAPLDGIPRHPVQFYELLGDLVIAAILLRTRRRLFPGGMFLLYLVLFSVLRFFLFFVRGDVPTLSLGLKNGQWTALVILALAGPAFLLLANRQRKARVVQP